MSRSSGRSREPLTAGKLRAVLVRERLVPVLRTASEAELRGQVTVAREAGLGVLELTTTSPGWVDVLRWARTDPAYRDVVVGAGTVTTAEHVETALSAGAQFLVAPYLAPAARTAAAGRVTLVEGGMSPAEVAAASAETGLAKVYPASSVGPAHVRALTDVLPGCGLMPTGGVTTESASAWIAAGAIAVGMGSSLMRLPAPAIRALQQSLREAMSDA